MGTCVLVIGGSDSSAGAGIQADVKTAHSMGIHAACAVTCVTAQNTLSFDAVQLVEPGLIEKQVASAAADLNIAAVKVGMLGSPEAAVAVERALADLLKKKPGLPVVIDPVLAASTQSEDGREVIARAICRHLLPLATVVTPNLPESRRLAQCCQQILSGATTADNRVASAPEHASNDVLAAWSARSMLAAGAGSVLVKGGHGSDAAKARDLLFGNAADLALSAPSELVESAKDDVPSVRFMVRPGDRDMHMSRPVSYSSPRIEGEFHGTGCVLSTAIACGLAQDKALPVAVGDAHAFLHEALEHSGGLGRGSKIIEL